jgi:dUTP pyrophosphatase
VTGEKEEVQVQLLSGKAKIPIQATPQSAGYDLYATESVSIAPGKYKVINTDLALALPKGTYGRIAPRSGLAVNHGVDILAGVIDADYRGPIKIAAINHGVQPVNILQGERAAQLILEKIAHANMIEVAKLTRTSRNATGFGASGKM